MKPIIDVVKLSQCYIILKGAHAPLESQKPRENLLGGCSVCSTLSHSKHRPSPNPYEKQTPVCLCGCKLGGLPPTQNHPWYQLKSSTMVKRSLRELPEKSSSLVAMTFTSNRWVTENKVYHWTKEYVWWNFSSWWRTITMWSLILLWKSWCLTLFKDWDFTEKKISLLLSVYYKNLNLLPRDGVWMGFASSVDRLKSRHSRSFGKWASNWPQQHLSLGYTTVTRCHRYTKLLLLILSKSTWLFTYIKRFNQMSNLQLSGFWE